MIRWKYSEEDKKQIEDFLKEWQAYPISPLTFAIGSNGGTTVRPD